MIPELLEEQAALYAAGALPTVQRNQFELILDHHPELQRYVRSLENVTGSLELTLPRPAARPAPALKARVLSEIGGRSQHGDTEGFVMACAEGLVEWVNPAFSALCGYDLSELRGRKLGPILQGELTCAATAARMRDALQRRIPCDETLVNYRKDGSPYWVAIKITPLHDVDGKLLYFVAREHELAGRPIAA